MYFFGVFDIRGKSALKLRAIEIQEGEQRIELIFKNALASHKVVLSVE